MWMLLIQPQDLSDLDRLFAADQYVKLIGESGA